MRWRIPVIIVGGLIMGVTRASAVPFKPTISEPLTYREVQKGVKELRENIETVSCGGWDTVSHAGAKIGGNAATIGGCRVTIQCAKTCPNTLVVKKSDGTIPICLSTTRRYATDQLLYKLQQAAQVCPYPPGFIPASVDCCSAQTDAFNLACTAYRNIGGLANTGISVQDCAQHQATRSCMALTGTSCGNPSLTAAQIKALDSLIANGVGHTCSQERATPPASSMVQSALDAIKKIAMSNDTSVVRYDAVGFPMPLVTGAPGRGNALPFGNITSGVGVRGIFQYPAVGKTGDPSKTEDNSGAWGFVSTCDITSHDYLIRQDDPATKENEELRIDINPESLCIREKGTDKRTPEHCAKLYRQLRTLAAQHLNDKDSCGIKIQYCFDDGNTYECAGNGCRTRERPAFQYTTALCVETPDGIVKLRDASVTTRNQSSFFRHYDIDVKANPENAWKLRSECYGYYRENDPLVRATTASDEQCEIAFLGETAASGSSLSSVASGSAKIPINPAWNPEWRPLASQKKNVRPDPSLFPATDDDLPARSMQAPWIGDTQTNLALLDMKAVREAAAKNGEQSNDILPYVSLALPVHQKASKTTSPLSTTDAFDDTGKRSFVTYWTAQQRELLKLTYQPRLSLLLPSRFMTGLDTSDPLLQLSQSTIAKSRGVTEATIHAAPEELGGVLQSLGQTFFLPVKEVRVPIIIPLLADNEADSLIADWRLWLLENPSADHEKTVEAFIKKIESYKEVAQRSRDVRSALPAYLQNVFAVQNKLRGFYAQWYLQNSVRLREWSDIASRRTALAQTEKRISQALLETVDCMVQWCSNHRYGPAVYSLLDSWLSAGKSVDALSPVRDAGNLPDLRSLNYRQEQDLSFDFSWLSVSGATIRIPVLVPIQISLKLPIPPSYTNNVMPDIADFPDIPSMKEPYGSILGTFAVPDIHFPKDIVPTGSGATYSIGEQYLIPSPSSLASEPLIKAQDMMNTLLSVVAGSNDRTSLKGAYCRFEKSITYPPDPTTADARRIVHVENDLRERIMRLFARPMPNMTEDVLGKKERLGVSGTSPICTGDGVCGALPGQKSRSFKWGIVLPLLDTSVSATYEKIVKAVLPPSEDLNPYYDTQRTILLRLLPLIHLPVPWGLDPFSSQ